MATPPRGSKFGQSNLILLVGVLTELKSKNDLSKVTYRKLKDDLEQALKIYIPDSTLRTTCEKMGIVCQPVTKNGKNLHGDKRFQTIKRAILELAESLGHLSPAITELKNLQ